MEYRFKEIRESYELKQHEVAQIMGVSRGGYANIEAETANVKLTQLLRFANHFNLSLDYVCKLSLIKNPTNLIKIDEIDKKVMRERLIQIEQEVHKSARAIADELGIQKSTYSEYKNVKKGRLMQTLMVKQIAKKYSYSIDWIIGRSDKKRR